MAGPIRSLGLLLLDTKLKPVWMNREALDILSYPEKTILQGGFDRFLTGKLGVILGEQAKDSLGFATSILSGRRVYQCRVYMMNSALGRSTPRFSYAVLLERESRQPTCLSELSRRFRLTPREGQVLQHLLAGLTSKEIAQRMQISPHTVKGFLRLLMIKMGVSTRSGIVGKAVSLDDVLISAESQYSSAD